MQKLGTKHIYFLLQKSSRQILQQWKTIFRKRFAATLCAIFGTEGSHDITHNISKN
jgi:hypothetical protein